MSERKEQNWNGREPRAIKQRKKGTESWVYADKRGVNILAQSGSAITDTRITWRQLRALFADMGQRP